MLALCEPAAGDAVGPVILEHRVDSIASKLAPTGGVVGMLALWEPACRRCCGPVILEHRVDSIASKLAPAGWELNPAVNP